MTLSNPTLASGQTRQSSGARGDGAVGLSSGGQVNSGPTPATPTAARTSTASAEVVVKRRRNLPGTPGRRLLTTFLYLQQSSSMAPRIDLNLEYDETEVEAPEENVTPVTSPESADDDEGIIPFRTSKRLQGAIYRMIQQQDGSRSHDNMPVAKDRNLGATLPLRKVKRRLESFSPERIDACKAEDRTLARADPGADIAKEAGGDVVKTIGSRKRKTKSFTVHFADPLFAVIDDQKESASKQLSMSKGEDKDRHSDEETPAPSVTKRVTHADGIKQQRLPPMSCFDLLCNHVGPRGWRCYRTCEGGKSFCRFHDSRKTLSFESGIMQAVHI